MPRCPACRGEISDGSRFCPRCGAALGSTASAGATSGDDASPTRTVRAGAAHAGAAPRAGTSRPSSPRPISGSPSEGRFLPGTMLAGRYRVFGLVGRGGMGEVYRADDLKLGQAVALKFLPADVERDAERLSRFLDEVRIARQISHPNVCRVYDVGEVDGHHFLSMEFVDGEDLASLLRRIGRLPRDKAIQIARQMCAGLAAAHEQGILHRDLKPGNVMIDGRGRARITDFGLARLAGDVRGAEAMAGTPAYMAPEQIAGEAVTMRSDLYALGLVLYEVCTGQPAFKGTTVADLARQKSETTPTSPGQIVDGFDPAVERVILRCLEREPANRPASALQVAAALPGGDPLAAALAAGETPSPELVAEAGAVGGLTPAAAWACLAALAAMVSGVVMLGGQSQISRMVPLPKSPDVLCDRARGIIQTLGYTDPPADSDFGFSMDALQLEHVSQGQKSRPGWMAIASGPPYIVTFWYKQSPRLLQPYDDIRGVPSIYDDPPLLTSGMIRLRLDPEGRLKMLEAVPPEHDATPPSGGAPDWGPLLTQAGFDPGALKPVEPEWAPLVYADARAAWEGAYPQAAGIPLRIEAAAFHGRPVALRVFAPWVRPTRMGTETLTLWQESIRILSLALVIAVMAGGVLVARRNLRLGRGDRKGARRLAVYVLAAATLNWVLDAHHVTGFAEFAAFTTVLGFNLLLAGSTWTFYLALEPFLRRLWPKMIVSWVRLLDGRWRDPLVGRDLLVGLLAAAGIVLATRFMVIAPAWVGVVPLRPDTVGPPIAVELASLRGLRYALGNLCVAQALNLVFPMGYLIFLLLCRLALRRTWLAVTVFIVVTSLSFGNTGADPVLEFSFSAVSSAFFLVVLFRFGLLSILALTSASGLLTVFPLTFDTSAWYAGATVIGLGAFAAIALYAFRTSLAGRPSMAREMASETG